jgi:hypothetical protein
MSAFDNQILKVVAGAANDREAIEWLNDYFVDQESRFQRSTLMYFLDKARAAENAEVAFVPEETP